MHKYHNKNTIFVKKAKIIVSNLKRTLAFYTNILGLTLVKEEAGAAQLGTNGKDVLLVLEEIKSAKPAVNILGLYHFALLLKERSSFAQFLKHLADAGYPITGLSDHGSSEAVYLEDPVGNGIEVSVDRHG